MFKDFEYEIKVDPKVKPVVYAPRRLPIALQHKLEAAVNKMEKKGIISKVEGFTPWTNSLMIQEKPNGKWRICLDPKDLNTAIIDDPNPIPTLDDIIHKFNFVWQVICRLRLLECKSNKRVIYVNNI